MREITDIDEFKTISLNILKYIDDLCKRNEIDYYLAYGTCIGAIRHHGFIPWDDDIDICMTRESFERFSTAINKEVSNYKLLYLDSEDYSLPLPKVIDSRTVLKQLKQENAMDLGVFVDVFILDNTVNDTIWRKIWYSYLNYLQICWSYAQYNKEYSLCEKDSKAKKIFRNFFYLYCKHRGARHFALKLDRFAGILKKKNTGYIGAIHFSYNRKKGTYPRYYFSESQMALFEDGYFPVSKWYDKYLRIHYGNYMELPPPNQRHSHHDYVIWDNGL